MTTKPAAKHPASFFEIADLLQERTTRGRSYLEFLNVQTLSAGVYVLEAGTTDSQSPHPQDEMYYVIRGRAHMRVGLDDHAVCAGSVIFVEAGAEHAFNSIEEELVVLVFFAPAET